MKDLGTNILNYDSVKEFKDFLQTDKDFGTCVIDNIVGMYNKSLGITREMFINFCSKYYTSPLDINPFELMHTNSIQLFSIFVDTLKKF